MPGFRRMRIGIALVCAILAVVLSCRAVAHEAPLQLAAIPTALTSDLRLPPNAGLDEPYGFAAGLRPDPRLDAKWLEAEQGIRSDAALVEACRASDGVCTSAARRFIALADSARGFSGRAALGVVNRAVNLAIAPLADLVQHGREDVWSSPLSTLATGKGDCEDYAIVKVALLQALGVAVDDLRVIVVRDPASPDSHAVAAARLEGRWFILDNRRFALVDAANSFYRPLFVLAPHRDETAGVKSLAQGSPGFGGSPLLL